MNKHEGKKRNSHYVIHKDGVRKIQIKILVVVEMIIVEC